MSDESHQANSLRTLLSPADGSRSPTGNIMPHSTVDRCGPCISRGWVIYSPPLPSLAPAERSGGHRLRLRIKLRPRVVVNVAPPVGAFSGEAINSHSLALSPLLCKTKTPQRSTQRLGPGNHRVIHMDPSSRAKFLFE